MDLLENLKNTLFCAKDFRKCNNFYFQNHICEENGDNIKVELKYKLSADDTDKIMKFGICDKCKTLFYCYDFETSSL